MTKTLTEDRYTLFLSVSVVSELTTQKHTLAQIHCSQDEQTLHHSDQFVHTRLHEVFSDGSEPELLHRSRVRNRTGAADGQHLTGSEVDER